MPRSASEAGIDHFLTRESWRGERWAASLRLGISAAAAFRMIALERAGVFQDDPSLTFPLAGLLMGVLVSAISLWRWRPDRARFFGEMVLSVTFDALLLLAIMLPRVVWPNEQYHGITHTTEFVAFALVIIGAGLRLSRRIAIYGTALNLATVIGLVVLDRELNAPILQYNMTQATLTLILLVGAGAISYGVAARTNRLVRDGADYAIKMGAYISEAFMDLVMNEQSGLYPNVAVLFSDLRNFTGYAQGIQPGQLINELNDYLEAMVRVINDEGGVVDKYIGDSIMVVYGVPQTKGDEALRAIRTAWRMERALTDHNTRRALAGLPPLRQGIGVHYGPVIAGIIGTEKKLQYTIVGDTVNVASRLEGLSKELGRAVVLSERLVEASQGLAGLPTIVPIGTAKIRGWTGEQTVYTLAPEGVPAAALPQGERPAIA
jgi:class 3 adenylate cyclase